jgi:hypothetical protein
MDRRHSSTFSSPDEGSIKDATLPATTLGF